MSFPPGGREGPCLTSPPACATFSPTTRANTGSPAGFRWSMLLFLAFCVGGSGESAVAGCGPGQAGCGGQSCLWVMPSEGLAGAVSVFSVIWEWLPSITRQRLLCPWGGAGGVQGMGPACCGWWTDTGMRGPPVRVHSGGLCPISHRHVTPCLPESTCGNHLFNN